MTQTYNASRAIPNDDESLQDHAARTANATADQDTGSDDDGAGDDSGAVQRNDAEVESAAGRGADSNAGADTEGNEAGEDDSDDLGIDDPAILEAVLNSDQTTVPAAVAAQLRRERRQAEAEAAAQRVRADEMERRQREQQQRQQQQQKPRDFDAELTELRKRYKADDSTMTEDEYQEARDAIRDARAEARLMEKIAPEVNALRNTVAQREFDALQQRMNAATDKICERYPFLDPENEDANQAAIDEVVAERDDLIKHGIDPVRALRMAVNEVAPKYEPRRVARRAEEGSEQADEIAARRLAAAKKAAIAAAGAQAPPINRAGVGTKVAGDGVVLGRGVDDHEKWLKMDDAQRAKIKIAH